MCNAELIDALKWVFKQQVGGGNWRGAALSEQSWKEQMRRAGLHFQETAIAMKDGVRLYEQSENRLL